jgi:transcriptional regulator with XRE-family HTH domain
MTFGEHLKKVLDELGVSQRQLAIKTGKDPSYISKIINGDVSVSWDMIQLFAETLGINPANFFVNDKEELLKVLLSELPDDLKEFVKDRKNHTWLVTAKDLSEMNLTPEQVTKVVQLWKETIEKSIK